MSLPARLTMPVDFPGRATPRSRRSRPNFHEFRSSAAKSSVWISRNFCLWSILAPQRIPLETNHCLIESISLVSSSNLAITASWPSRSKTSVTAKRLSGKAKSLRTTSKTTLRWLRSVMLYRILGNPPRPCPCPCPCPWPCPCLIPVRKHGIDQRGVPLDIRANNHHVPGLDGLIIAKQP
ncbi:MAG: hypothetical protein BWX66_01447 [Deltaproteobacteria bacterium ADurb.Bin058]|nr:MAG: hypothetical protein BWX66_01447 [Deltaproteobacteria bacterium ADurb.Bin058]